MQRPGRSTSNQCSCGRTVLAAVGIALLLYWGLCSFFLTTSKNPIPSINVPSAQHNEIVVQDPAALPIVHAPSTSSDALLNVNVTFSLSNIFRDDATRTGKCNPEVCYQQCDPACKQLPKKIQECTKPPCADKEPWLIYNAEVEYPLFLVNWPQFARPEDRHLFINAQPITTEYLPQHSRCPSPFARKPEPRCELIDPAEQENALIFSHINYMRGNIAVIHDGVYNGRPDDTFNEDTKCAYSSDYHWISPNDTLRPKARFDKLLVVMMSVTGGAFFQHFVDRGLSILTQAWSMIQSDPSIKLLVSPVFNTHPIVPQLYERMGLKNRLVYMTRNALPIAASRMYFSCVAPHYHPYVYQKARDILGIDVNYPLSNRRTLVYMSRRKFSRQVTNEEQLLTSINTLLKDMAQSGKEAYQLEVFDHSQMKHVNQTIDYFNTKARALIGPHGGAMYNQIFCASNTLVIEFFPYLKKAGGFGAIRWPEAVWWPATFMGHTYYQQPTHSPVGGTIAVDVEAVLSILRKELW